MIYKYTEFLLELRKVVSNTSSSGNTKTVDLIHNEPSSSKSLASSILLRKELSELEDKQVTDLIGNVPKWVINRFKQKGDIKLKVTLNNLQFLKDKLKERGKLYCEYCNKGPLTIYTFSEKDIINMIDGIRLANFDKVDGATCDHKIPQSKGGDKLNYDNLAVCCYRCNNKKGNVGYEVWLNFLESDKGKEWLAAIDTKLKKNPSNQQNSPKYNLNCFKRYSKNFDDSPIKVQTSSQEVLEKNVISIWGLYPI